MANYIELQKLTVKHNSCKIDCYFRKSKEEIESLKALNKGIFPDAEIKVETVKIKREEKDGSQKF